MEKALTVEQIDEVITSIDVEAKVIVHNDDWHTFDEVIRQLVRAVHCTRKRAEHLAHTIHNKGRATVYEGSMEDCLFVSAVLEEIDLLTTIEV